MANNRVQVKRTNTSGLLANVTDPANTRYIAAGEFALNMADGILYSSNGTAIIEIGANNTNSRVTGTLTVNAVSANGGVGTAGQVLTSNGTISYWADAAGGGGVYLKGGTATIGSLGTEGQNLFRVNANTLNFNTTIATGENAQATGPISVASGITLTVESGARVAIV